ncbi:37S ribosomal protein S23 mitochondrial [Xylographa carneopallida]|nr:37S ribosomal protein S23 mitochondrial [Xylographa carneopallida]
MSSARCRSCIARAPAHLNHLPPYRHPNSLVPFRQHALFSTTAPNLANPTPKSRSSKQPGGPPKRGEKTTYARKKKKHAESKARPPAPGERKALRKRIVLSNTNALEVPGMQDLTADAMGDVSLQGRVVGIPGAVVDQLRASEAFKTCQGWALFRRPGMLVRAETVAHGELIRSMSDAGDTRTVRRIYVGERGSGKSTMLLQAMTMAFLQGWVVVNFPEGQDLTIGHTEYSPLPGSSPPLYQQKTYTAALLSRLVRANPLLSTLSLSQAHPSFPTPLQPNLSLSQLASLGASDPDLSHSAFSALWTELARPSTPQHPRPKLLLALDGLAHVMRPSAYRSPAFVPIHAYDLALVRFFTTHLAGTAALPNGGLVLAATSASNHPTVPTLEFKLRQIAAAQDPAREAPSRVQPFLTATGQAFDPVPRPEPFVQYDERVMDVLGGERAEGGIEVRRLEGVSREEARGLMEYWARSGMMRTEVGEGLVAEKWTLSGGGVVGELERGCVRMRV